MFVSHWCTSLFRDVKINQQKLRLKWSQKSRRENSHTCVTWLTLSTPMGRDIPDISYRNWYYLRTFSKRARGRFLLAQQQLSQWDMAITQPMKTHCTSNFVSSSGFFLYNTPSHVHKRALSSFVSLDLCVVCPQTACPELKVSLVSKFCWRIIWLSICLRSTGTWFSTSFPLLLQLSLSFPSSKIFLTPHADSSPVLSSFICFSPLCSFLRNSGGEREGFLMGSLFLQL